MFMDMITEKNLKILRCKKKRIFLITQREKDCPPENTLNIKEISVTTWRTLFPQKRLSQEYASTVRN